jgi:hypothetical protein
MAKKIPVPKIKSKKSGSSFPWTTLQLGLSSLLNRNPLTLGKIPGRNTAAYGSKAWRAQQLANMAKMGKWSGRFAGLGRFGVMNPWLMAPAALTGAAKYSVGKAFDPYRDETGKIGTEGHARLTMAARARERGIRKEDMDLEPFLRAQQELELNRPTYAQLRESFLARQNQNEGGIARLV